MKTLSGQWESLTARLRRVTFIPARWATYLLSALGLATAAGATALGLR